MADLHLKVSSAWKPIDAAYVKVSSSWKTVKAVYVKVSGAWKRSWSNYVVNLDGHVISSGIHARVYLHSDGTVGAYTLEVGSPIQIDSATDWIIPNSEAAQNDFEAKWVQTVGGGTDPVNQTSVGWTEDTWADLTSDLYVGRNESPGVSFIDIEITIRRKSDSVVLATGTYELNIT